MGDPERLAVTDDDGVTVLVKAAVTESVAVTVEVNDGEMEEVRDKHTQTTFGGTPEHDDHVPTQPDCDALGVARMDTDGDTLTDGEPELDTVMLPDVDAVTDGDADIVGDNDSLTLSEGDGVPLQMQKAGPLPVAPQDVRQHSAAHGVCVGDTV